MPAVIPFDTDQLIHKYLPRNRLDSYYELLMKRNRSVNLVSRETSRADFDRMVAESLLPLEYLAGPFEGYLDIGSGGGIPAIPILLSGVAGGRSVLVERTIKKARALEGIAKALNLPCRVAAQNFEEITNLPRPRLATLRNVKLTDRLLKAIMDTLAPGGAFVYYSRPAFKPRKHGPVVRRFKSGQDSVLKSLTIFQKYSHR